MPNCLVFGYWFFKKRIFMKKIFMVLLLLPFIAVYSAQIDCDKIKLKIEDFDFKLTNTEQNLNEFLEKWDKACETCGTKSSQVHGCEGYKKVKVPWGPPKFWPKRLFSSVLKEPCLQLGWPVIDTIDGRSLALTKKKCVADECVLKAHYAYTLYKKLKKQIPLYRQPNLEEKENLQKLAEAMSKKSYDLCSQQRYDDYQNKVQNEKSRIQWEVFYQKEIDRLKEIRKRQAEIMRAQMRAEARQRRGQGSGLQQMPGAIERGWEGAGW
jgi:hypothetical protein